MIIGFNNLGVYKKVDDLNNIMGLKFEEDKYEINNGNPVLKWQNEEIEKRIKSTENKQ